MMEIQKKKTPPFLFYHYKKTSNNSISKMTTGVKQGAYGLYRWKEG